MMILNLSSVRPCHRNSEPDDISSSAPARRLLTMSDTAITTSFLLSTMTPRRRDSGLLEDQAESLQQPLLCEDADENVEELREASAETSDNAPPRSVRSRNIPLVLTYTALAFAGRSLWAQSVLSTFVYLLENNNAEAVGFITAVMGMSQLAVSLPTGVLADRYRRDAVLKVASAVGFKAILISLFAIWQTSYQWLTLALAVYGAFWGLANTSLTALFADSIRDGDRSYYFTKRSILINIGNTTGPIVAMILFQCLGDTWTVRDCAVVMGVGQVLCIPAVCLLCWLDDDDAVSHDEEELTPVGRATSNQELTVSSADSDESSPEEEDTSTDQATTGRRLCTCIPDSRIVPVYIAMADVASGLGSGMSIRYFPVFFLDSLHLNPVAVQVLYTLGPLGQASLMHVGQMLAKRLGRCKTAVAYKWTGVACMLAMIASYVSHMPVWFVCFLYLVRTSFMNATSALTKSVLMDYVPKRERGKWSALESVNMFSWSGSAAVGGLLVGYKGILFNFCVTAAIQLIATFPLIALFAREKPEDETQAAQRDDSKTTPATTTPQVVRV
jgi:MFS family permease